MRLETLFRRIEADPDDKSAWQELGNALMRADKSDEFNDFITQFMSHYTIPYFRTSDSEKTIHELPISLDGVQHRLQAEVIPKNINVKYKLTRLLYEDADDTIYEDDEEFDIRVIARDFQQVDRQTSAGDFLWMIRNDLCFTDEEIFETIESKIQEIIDHNGPMDPIGVQWGVRGINERGVGDEDFFGRRHDYVIRVSLRPEFYDEVHLDIQITRNSLLNLITVQIGSWGKFLSGPARRYLGYSGSLHDQDDTHDYFLSLDELSKLIESYLEILTGRYRIQLDYFG